jgi:hypothetical protein
MLAGELTRERNKAGAVVVAMIGMGEVAVATVGAEG